MKASLLVLAAVAAGLWGCVARDGAAPRPVALYFPYEGPDGPSIALSQPAVACAVDSYVRVRILAETTSDGKRRLATLNAASGVVVDPRGYVVTAAHIALATENRASVTTMDGQLHEALVLDVSPSEELALLSVEPFEGMKAAAPAPGSPALGSPAPGLPDRAVFALGAPDNRMGAVSLGRIARKDLAQPIGYGPFAFEHGLELEMVIEPGFSGGPVFDTGGGLVGILTSYVLGDIRSVPYQPTGVAYAVGARGLRAYLDRVLPVARSARGLPNSTPRGAPNSTRCEVM